VDRTSASRAAGAVPNALLSPPSGLVGVTGGLERLRWSLVFTHPKHWAENSCTLSYASIRWEYKTLHLSTTGWLGGKLDHPTFEKMLNDLGLDAWELVSVFDTNQSSGQTREVIAVFKRPR
jgi:hypothetical protein